MYGILCGRKVRKSFDNKIIVMKTKLLRISTIILFALVVFMFYMVFKYGLNLL